MARGDYYEVWLKDETTPRLVQATRVGSSVALNMNEASPGKPGSDFITVLELDKAGVPIRTCQYAKSEVQSIEQGNRMIKGKK